MLVVAAVALLPASGAAQTTDDSNGASRFIKDVVGDYVHYFSLENAEILGLGGAAAGGAHAADESVAHWVQTTQPNTWIGAQEYGSQAIQLPLAIAWWAIGGLAHSGANADAGRDLVRAQLSVVSWTQALQFATDRTRPNGDPRGFPSGHASASFATAMVLQEHYGWKLGVPAFAVATYVAASRVIANQHWTSDVVFGAAVGMASGRTVTLHLRNTRVSVAPLPVSGGGGVLVTAIK
jgi:hypothetical protein